MSAVLFRNFSYLTLAQAANYLIPLITIPYISRVVGVEKFGALEFSYTIVLYFIQFVEYSFDITATRRMAVISDNSVLVSRLFSAVFWSKILLWTLSTFIFAIFLIFNESLQKFRLPLLGYYFITTSFALSQNWFYQGLQKLGVVALSNVGIKLVFALLLFFLVKKESDYYLVAVSTTAGYMIVSAITFSYAFKLVPDLRLYFPGFRLLMRNLKNGFYVFAAGMTNKIYGLSGMYWAGILLSGVQLGQFSAGHKLYLVMQSMLFYPVHMTLLPHLSIKLKEGLQAYRKSLYRYLKWILAVTLVIVLAVYGTSPWIIKVLFGYEFEGTHVIFNLFLPSLVCSVFINMFVYQAFIQLKRDDLHLKAHLIMMVVSVLGNYLAIRYYQAPGGAGFRSLMDVFYVVMSWWWLIEVFNKKVINPS